MERIILSCLRLRTVIVAIAAVLVGAGLWQMRQMPLDAVPEFSPLTLHVRTEALAAAQLPAPPVYRALNLPYLKRGPLHPLAIAVAELPRNP